MIISTPFPPEEGIGYYAYNLSKKMVERGHILSVITRGNILKAETFDHEGIRVYKTRFIPTYPFHVDLQRLFLKNFIKNYGKDFDLLHIHSPLSPPLKCEKPLISTIHTSLIEDMKHFQLNNPKTVAIKLTTHISGRRLIQNLINNSDRVTTVSSAVATELEKYYGIQNSVVMGNGVDENIFRPLNCKDGDYVLYVGRLDYRKGILDIIEAFKYVKLTTKLFIAGEGPLRGIIENKIRKNNLDNIILLGHVSGENLVQLYQNAMIFVFPSYYEGLPTSLLEAMSCALPIITTNIPAHKDLIKNNYNGILVKISSPKEIANKINTLIDDEAFGKKLGSNARKTVEERFTWDIISKKFEKNYKRLIEVNDSDNSA